MYMLGLVLVLEFLYRMAPNFEREDQATSINYSRPVSRVVIMPEGRRP
jgi:hypothetical protein